MSHQPTPTQRDPLTRVRTRFLSNPTHFLRAVVEWNGYRRWQGLVIQRQPHPLALTKGKRFERSQDTMFVDGLKLTDHTLIVARAAVTTFP